MTEEGYAGNAQLPVDIRTRVETVFSQTVSLYAEGEMEDCVVGCDFVLRLDPEFSPARVLLSKAQNPQSQVDVGPILSRYGKTRKLDADKLMIQALEAFNARDFSGAADLVVKILAADPEHGEAEKLLMQVKEKMDALPFVQQFLTRARQFMIVGNREEALKLLNKGLVLDEDNPDLLGMIKEIESPRDSGEMPAALPESKNAPIAGSPPPFGFEPLSGSGTAAADQPFAFESAAPGGPSARPSTDEPFPGEPSPPMAAPSAVPAQAENLDEVHQPSAAAPLQAASLFSTEKGQTDKITALLSDGDRALENRDYQEAIDIWSRVFLMDIHNEEASRKIEEAKVLLAEQDRRIEEMFNLAVSLLHQGKKEEAARKFEEVLSHEPHHLAARDYLRQLQEEKAGKSAAAPPLTMEAPSVAEEALPPVPVAPARISSLSRGKTLWLPIGAAVGIIALLFLGWRFLGSGIISGRRAVDAAAVIAQAEALYQQGRIADALAELDGVPLEDPLHGKAVQMINTYRLEPRLKPAGMVDGRPLDVVAAEKRAQAFQAYQDKDFARAQDLYGKAAELKESPAEDRPTIEEINRVMELIKVGKTAFDDGHFEQSVGILTPIYEKDKVLQAKETLIRAYYNLGLAALREGNLGKAEGPFQQILKMDASDSMVQKNLQLIRRYRDVDKDLLYKTYVKYLKQR